MLDGYAGWMIVAGLMLASAAVGVFGCAQYRRRADQARRRIPRKWPLAVRAMVNSREKLVWRWLTSNFPDHHVMVKLPLTRFTMPQARHDGQHWFQILGSVYCTFTVCTPEGEVIGCLDVPTLNGLALSNQTLKHTLLAQCDIRYWVVEPENLPNGTLLRAAFLGEQAVIQAALERLRTEEEFNQTRSNLKAALTRQRHQQPGERARPQALLPPDPHSPQDDDSELSTSWRHDSFVAPLDSRMGELR